MLYKRKRIVDIGVLCWKINFFELTYNLDTVIISKWSNALDKDETVLDQDASYLLWLSKRLVYKYKEDPKTIKVVEEIINRNKYELDFYKKIQTSLHKHIDTSITSLEEIKKYYRTSVTNANKEYFQSKLNNTNNAFENFDFDKLR